MNKLKEFIKKHGSVPIIPLMGFPGIQLTGISVKTALFDEKAHLESLLALYDETRPDALFPMMDLTVEAEFLGCTLKCSENDPPTIAKGILEDKADDSDEMTFFENGPIGGRMQMFTEVVNGLSKSLDVPVGAYVIGPFTLAGEILGITRTMKITRKKPELLHHILKQTTELIMAYIASLEAAGANLICILEPSTMMLSPEFFKAFSAHYCQKIIAQSIKGFSILHICGDTNHLLPEMAKVGAEGLSLDKQVNLREASDLIGSDVVLIGNIDPVSVVTFDPVELVIKKSTELMNSMKGKESFIFSTGCDIPPNAPIENLKAIMELKNIQNDN